MKSHSLLTASDCVKVGAGWGGSLKELEEHAITVEQQNLEVSRNHTDFKTTVFISLTVLENEGKTTHRA